MNTKIIQKWLDENAPHAKEKLAAGANISLGTVCNILKDGHGPELEIAKRLAGVIGVSLDELCYGPAESPYQEKREASTSGSGNDFPPDAA